MCDDRKGTLQLFVKETALHASKVHLHEALKLGETPNLPSGFEVGLALMFAMMADALGPRFSYRDRARGVSFQRRTEWEKAKAVHRQVQQGDGTEMHCARNFEGSKASNHCRSHTELGQEREAKAAERAFWHEASGESRKIICDKRQTSFLSGQIQFEGKCLLGYCFSCEIDVCEDTFPSIKRIGETVGNPSTG